MNLVVNCQVKNEALLLEHVLPIWRTYPVDEFIFYDDASTDHTRDVITLCLGQKATIIQGKDRPFDEADNRQQMLNKSMMADYILSIDSDELVTANFWLHKDLVFNDLADTEHRVFCYNLAGNWHTRRSDPAYKNNFLCMTARPKDVVLDAEKRAYHTQRRLPSSHKHIKNIKHIGNIHLQSLNPGYYALKQLWYKHWEYYNLYMDARRINAKYDKVVNGMKWIPKPISKDMVEGLYIDPAVFDTLAQTKQYKQYVLDNLVPELVTFGHKYLYD